VGLLVGTGLIWTVAVGSGAVRVGSDVLLAVAVRVGRIVGLAGVLSDASEIAVGRVGNLGENTRIAIQAQTRHSMIGRAMMIGTALPQRYTVPGLADGADGSDERGAPQLRQKLP
jgi:hypothetical protein